RGASGDTRRPPTRFGDSVASSEGIIMRKPKWQSVADVCERWQARYQRKGFGGDTLSVLLWRYIRHVGLAWETQHARAIFLDRVVRDHLADAATTTVGADLYRAATATIADRDPHPFRTGLGADERDRPLSCLRPQGGQPAGRSTCEPPCSRDD